MAWGQGENPVTLKFFQTDKTYRIRNMKAKLVYFSSWKFSKINTTLYEVFEEEIYINMLIKNSTFLDQASH